MHSSNHAWVILRLLLCCPGFYASSEACCEFLLRSWHLPWRSTKARCATTRSWKLWPAYRFVRRTLCKYSGQEKRIRRPTSETSKWATSATWNLTYLGMHVLLPSLGSKCWRWRESRLSDPRCSRFPLPSCSTCEKSVHFGPMAVF